VDGERYRILRRYSEFHALQLKLIENFPLESGQNNPNQRILPTIPGKVLFGRSQTHEVAEQRLPELNVYIKVNLSFFSSFFLSFPFPFLARRLKEKTERRMKANPAKPFFLKKKKKKKKKKELLALDIKISRCKEVAEFFSENEKDLEGVMLDGPNVKRRPPPVDTNLQSGFASFLNLIFHTLFLLTFATHRMMSPPVLSPS